MGACLFFYSGNSLEFLYDVVDFTSTSYIARAMGKAKTEPLMRFLSVAHSLFLEEQHQPRRFVVTSLILSVAHSFFGIGAAAAAAVCRLTPSLLLFVLRNSSQSERRSRQIDEPLQRQQMFWQCRCLLLVGLLHKQPKQPKTSLPMNSAQQNLHLKQT